MRRFTTSVVVGIAALAAAEAAAQEPEARERERVERSVAATPADPQAGSGDELVRAASLDLVLRAPEDVRVNLDYARSRIAAGDLKEAATALERVLLIQPELAQARVLYGFVLYRLGMLDRALFELEAALKGDLDARTRAETEHFVRRLRKELRRTQVSATLTAGVDFDTNRTQAPESGTSLFLGFPISVEGADESLAQTRSARLEVTHDLGLQSGHALIGDIYLYRSDKFEEDRLDLDAAFVSAGARLDFGAFTVTPLARYGHYRLDHEEYLNTLGGEIEVSGLARPSLRLFVSARADDERFRRTPTYPAARFRTGDRYGLRAGAEWAMNPGRRLRFEAYGQDKQAAAGFEAYGRYGLAVQHQRLHPGGVFTAVGLAWERSEYDEADLFISPAVREDEAARFSASAGVPLDLALGRPGPLRAMLKGVSAVVQYEYETVDSNLPNYAFDSHRTRLTFSKRFSF